MVQYPNSIKLKVIKSTSATAQQKYGVFAMETVEPNKVIVEFTGQVIRLDVAYTREERYWETGIQPNMFKVDDEYVSFFGVKKRFGSDQIFGYKNI